MADVNGNSDQFVCQLYITSLNAFDIIQRPDPAASGAFDTDPYHNFHIVYLGKPNDRMDGSCSSGFRQITFDCHSNGKASRLGKF